MRTEAQKQVAAGAVRKAQDGVRKDPAFQGLVTVTAVATVYQVSRQAVLKAISSGQLPAKLSPTGRGWWVSPADAFSLYSARRTRYTKATPAARRIALDMPREGVVVSDKRSLERAKARNRREASSG